MNYTFRETKAKKRFVSFTINIFLHMINIVLRVKLSALNKLELYKEYNALSCPSGPELIY